MADVLYISYDGLLEALGYSQVFQYLRVLAKDHRITLISYEKAADWQDRAKRDRLLAEVDMAGIRWMPLRYHKKPSALATAYDLGVGFLLAAFLVVTRRIKIVHARSYVPAVLALLLKKVFGTRFVFDMRGFWADERVERAGWRKEAPIYRIAKWLEPKFFGNADVVVSLTKAGVRAIGDFPYLKERPPVCQVISTCTNLEQFRPSGAKEKDGFVLGYVGSADAAYMFEPVLRCFKILHGLSATARLLVVTGTPRDYIGKLLQLHEIPGDLVEIKTVPHHLVFAEMGKMDAGIFFVKAGFSTSASAPTKLGEFLACGVPCLCNANIGDLQEILEGGGVGVILEDFTPEGESRAVSQLRSLALQPDISERCREASVEHFSLEKGAANYHEIYRSLQGGS